MLNQPPPSPLNTLHSSSSTCGSSSVSFSNICLFQPRNRNLVFSFGRGPAGGPAGLRPSAVLLEGSGRQRSVMLWLASLLSKWRNFICTFPAANTICGDKSQTVVSSICHHDHIRTRPARCRDLLHCRLHEHNVRSGGSVTETSQVRYLIRGQRM